MSIYQQKVREAFEAWMKSREGYPFAGQFADLMWKAWQAALAHASSATVKENLTVGSGDEVATVCDCAKARRGFLVFAQSNGPVQVGTKLYTHPAPSAEDARDVARYRYVRNSCGEFVRYAGGGSYWLLEDEALDKAIDQALAAERGEGNG